MKNTFDVIAFGAHPDDLEAVMGGTAIKLRRNSLSVLFVDLCEGEPARHAARRERHKQAVKAAVGARRSAPRALSDGLEGSAVGKTGRGGARVRIQPPGSFRLDGLGGAKADGLEPRPA